MINTNCGDCVAECQFAGRKDVRNIGPCDDYREEVRFTSPMDEYAPPGNTTAGRGVVHRGK